MIHNEAKLIHTDLDNLINPFDQKVPEYQNVAHRHCYNVGGAGG